MNPHLGSEPSNGGEKEELSSFTKMSSSDLRTKSKKSKKSKRNKKSKKKDRIRSKSTDDITPRKSRRKKQEQTQTPRQQHSQARSRRANPMSSKKHRADLPTLERCLYGAKRRSPFIPDDCDASGRLDSGDTDSHDIDMAMLRKICSHGGGIPEESEETCDANNRSDDDPSSNAPQKGFCQRGVVWRVLLEQLSDGDITSSWPWEVPLQRKLYRDLVNQYLGDANDPGKNLKDIRHLESDRRSSRHDNNNRDNREEQSKVETPQLIREEIEDNDDEPSECSSIGDEFDLDAPLSSMFLSPKAATVSNTDDEGETETNKAVNSSTRWSESKSLDSAHIRVTEDIYDGFSPNSKYREMWRRSGITLNKGHSAAAIGMNHLKIPEELYCDDSDDEGEFAENETLNDSTTTSISIDNKKDRLFERYCRDAKLLEEIRKDVVRTHPQLRFFQEPRHNLGIRRHAAIERVLFVWAKLNGNLYVQGMNEIVGTIYYVLARDRCTSVSVGNKRHCWADHAEEDTYHLFHGLMTNMDIRDVFVADLDHDGTVGLHARIQKIEDLLALHDPEVHHHLTKYLGLSSSFYALRWLTTLLSREFPLADTIRLWDGMFASTHKENFLRYVCASMVMAIRDRLFRGDFGTCMKLLQNYPSGDISMDELLESSRALWIYETQISLARQKGGVSLHHALSVLPPPPGIIMAFGRPGRGQEASTASSGSSWLPNQNSTTDAVGEMTLGAAAVANRMMGRAKRMWNYGWNGNTTEGDKQDKANHKNSSGTENEKGNSNTTKTSSGASEENLGWDLIDSIIDGDGNVDGTTSGTGATHQGAVAPGNRNPGYQEPSYSLLGWRGSNETNNGGNNPSGNNQNRNNNNTDNSNSNGRFWSRIRRKSIA